MKSSSTASSSAQQQQICSSAVTTASLQTAYCLVGHLQRHRCPCTRNRMCMWCTIIHPFPWPLHKLHQYVRDRHIFIPPCCTPGVRKLFDQATSKAELITVTSNPAARLITITWRLEGRVNLPFKPKIKPYVVTTTLGLDDDGLICSQVDEFSVPGYDLLLSIIFGEGGWGHS